ncbi:MAG: succinate dehydrogenase, cytochrome b subunit [Rickettsiaceae bacterium]|jgi:succinate dehydrogenase / fumarate reductase membrane anchor subunit|nr:succinate dehydrogenase, cytochrome b subunit [Rickettsiaceae bacterium]
MKIPPSTKTGAHSWLILRISAIALIPLVIWLVLSVMQIIQNPITYMPIFFAYPLNAFMGILFAVFSLYHGSLGMKEVIEDYVSCKMKKHFYIILIHFISIFTGAAIIVAILRLHLVG